DELHPADLAAAYEALPADPAAVLLGFLEDDVLAAVLTQLPLVDAEEILLGLPDDRLARVLDGIPDDILVDVLQEMPGSQRGHAFHLLSESRRRAARELLKFPDDSAGGRMTTAFASVREDMSVRQAVDSLRGIADETELLARIYVTDHEGLLLGKVRLRDLTFSDPSTLIEELNDRDTRAVLTSADQEKAMRMIMKYDMLAMPVLDEDGRLMGVITHDDALDIQQEESTEDMELQSGISGEITDETYLNTSVLRQVRRRFGWIISLAFLGLISGTVIYSYQNQLNTIFALTVYMPMIVAAGGNTGGQAATMVVRAMSVGELEAGAVLRVAWKELRIGLIVGGLVAVAMVVQIFLLRPAFITLSPPVVAQFALTVGLALLCQITASTLIGAILPLGARAVRLDPAVIAAPAITTIVDATGLLIYLNLARAILPI
ncbi:MAG: magnesium transporter, partial [Verrucomicrobiaceae bacterium]